jgi:tripartite-type tricarboxylate transporter receptor subunit TctC
MHAIVLVSLFGAVLMSAAVAQPSATTSSYPARPIRIIVPFSAGSGSDFCARQLAPKMTEHWGQQVVVDNRPSAGGTVAGETVARATPDGHTLLLTSSGIAATAALYPKLPYDTLKDFAAVSLVASGSTMFVSAPNSGLRTLKDLIAAAQRQPGVLTYGHSGVGSGTHYAAEYLNVAAGIKTVHVPYKGGSEVLTDVLGGRLNFGVVPLAPSVPLAKSGRIIALAVATSVRNPSLPDVPTVAESGVPGYSVDGWFGMFAPARTPAGVIKQISAEVVRILAMPDVRARFQAIATTPRGEPPEVLDRLLRTEIETRKRIFKDAGAQVQ